MKSDISRPLFWFFQLSKLFYINKYLGKAENYITSRIKI